MSWVASGWAKKTRGHRNSAQKLVLMVLADYYNDEFGYAWASRETLAADAEMSERNVIRHLKELERDGFLTFQRGNQHTVSKYHLSLTTYVSIRQTKGQAEGASDNLAHAEESDGHLSYTQVREGDNSPAMEEGANDIGDQVQMTPVSSVNDKALSPKPTRADSGEPKPEVTSATAPVTSGGAKPKKPKRVTEVTPEFREKMREKYSSLSAVDERIDEALAHKSAKKWTDMQQYVNGWLRRDAERTNGARASPGQSRLPGADRYQKLAEQAERLQDERKRRKTGESGQHSEAENGGERPP